MSIAKFKNDARLNMLRTVYLFWGDEQYLRKRYVNQIQEKLGDDSFKNMNISLFEGEIGIDDLTYACNTPPLLSPKRIVIVKNSGLFKSRGGARSKSADDIHGLLSTIPEQTCLIFDEDNVNPQSPFIEIVDKFGLVVECAYQNTQDIVKWVQLELKSFNKLMDGYSATYLVELCNREMSHINNEIHKLVNYVGERENIDKNDVDAVCIKPISTRIFDLADAMLQKNKSIALSILNDLIEMKESPVYIVLAIARHFRNMLKAKLLYQKGNTYKDIALNLKVPQFVAKKFVEQSSKLSIQQLKGVLIGCFEADYAIKTGQINGTTAVELLISK